MLGTLRLQRPQTATAMNPKCDGGSNFNQINQHCRLVFPLQKSFTLSLSLQQQSQSGLVDSSSDLTTSTVGSSSPPPIYLSQWTLTRRHIHVLNFVACAAAISSTWLFCSAIPALLAFRRAAISMEKLMDVTREELPDTMAAIRLSGMELSDLTMELGDLGQGLTKGIKSSTRAVRSAEEKLRQFTNTNTTVSLQEAVTPSEPKASGPVVARTARGIREGIVKGRAFGQMFFSVIHFTKILFNYLKPV